MNDEYYWQIRKSGKDTKLVVKNISDAEAQEEAKQTRLRASKIKKKKAKAAKRERRKAERRRKK